MRLAGWSFPALIMGLAFAPKAPAPPCEAWLDALCPLGVIAAVLYLYAGTLSPLAFQTHEALHPYARTLQLIGEVERGHLPPQVFPDAAGGAGARFRATTRPCPTPSPPAWPRSSAMPVRGVNLAFLLALLVSALATYALVRCVAGDPLLAACGALLAVSAPYRLGQVFVRGALAETWSLALYPLLLLGAWQAVERGRPPAWLGRGRWVACCSATRSSCRSPCRCSWCSGPSPSMPTA